MESSEPPEKVEAEVFSLQQQLATTRKELMASQATLSAVLRSKSWRITAPMRRVARCWRKTLHPGAQITLNEKIRLKMQHDRRPILTTFADKFAVRDYVQQRVGSKYLARLHFSTTDPEKIDVCALPRNFVLKANHASGGVVVVWDGADRSCTLPSPDHTFQSCCIHPDKLEPERLISSAKDWLTHTYQGPLGLEWCYQDIPRRILVEELLLTPQGTLPKDYKLFCFSGRPRWIQLDEDRFGDHTRNFYWPDWQPIPVKVGRYPLGPGNSPKPKCLDEMLSVARKLSRKIDFVRVDLYCTQRGVCFGELTNYPAAGSLVISPPQFEIELGKWWDTDAQRWR